VDDPHAFRIGHSNREHVIVSPSRRERPHDTDYWDGNWVYATVTIAAGAFRGSFEAQLRADEFANFRDELRPLYENLAGRAAFRPMEPWVTVGARRTSLGAPGWADRQLVIISTCAASPSPGKTKTSGRLMRHPCAVTMIQLLPRDLPPARERLGLRRDPVSEPTSPPPPRVLPNRPTL